MRMVIELDNKYLSIEIGDLEPVADSDVDTGDESVTAVEDEMRVTLPMGFQPPPTVLNDDNAPDGGTDDDDEDEEWEDD